MKITISPFIYFSTLYTYDIYVGWQANPTITVINTTSFPIKNVEFPAITICSQGLAKDIIENVLIQQFESYLESKKIITDPNAKLNKREILNISKQKKLEIRRRANLDKHSSFKFFCEQVNDALI